MDWSKPIPVDDATVAFPAHVEGKLLPPHEDLPMPYRDYNGYAPSMEVASEWFFNGLGEGAELTPREGIDPKMAFRQVKACLGSFEPKHEDKIHGVSYLLALFFSKVKVNGKEWEFELPAAV